MAQHKEGKIQRPKPDAETTKRLLRYVSSTYKLRFVFVLVFILISAAAGVAGALFWRY